MSGDREPSPKTDAPYHHLGLLLKYKWPVGELILVTASKRILQTITRVAQYGDRSVSE